MNLQKSENPASAPVFHLNADPEARPGGRWTDRQLSFGLQVRDALQLTYVFYEWEVKVDSYGDFLGPISWEKPGSVWVEEFSAKVLKIQGR